MVSLSFRIDNSCRGIRPEIDLFVRKFRFNQSFHLISAEDFLKALLCSPAFQSRLPAYDNGKIEKVASKHISCGVLNLSYFDFLEELNIVNGNNGHIRGAPDEWVDGIQCSNRLRLGLLWEDDENFEELQQDKY